jgi:hypothetical protein
MLSAIYEWGNRATWIAAAVAAILFFYAVIYAFPNARLAALQQARDVAEQEIGPSVRSTECRSAPASIRCAPRI